MIIRMKKNDLNRMINKKKSIKALEREKRRMILLIELLETSSFDPY